MKRLLLSILLLLGAGRALAQGEYYDQRRSLFEVLPIRSGDIVFLGNSITDGGEWAELFGNPRLRNRGISGDRAAWMLGRLDPILAGHPRQVYLMVGTNDLAGGATPGEVLADIGRIVSRFRSESPRTRLFVQSILPVNGRDFSKFTGHYAQSDAIVETNRLLQALCEEKGITYIDLWSVLADADGLLDSRYTNDGLHLVGAGYLVWRDALKPYMKR